MVWTNLLLSQGVAITVVTNVTYYSPNISMIQIRDVIVGIPRAAGKQFKLACCWPLHSRCTCSPWCNGHFDHLARRFGPILHGSFVVLGDLVGGLLPWFLGFGANLTSSLDCQKNQLLHGREEAVGRSSLRRARLSPNSA